MKNEKKLYAIKNDGRRVWETPLDLSEVEEILHMGAGCEMNDDKITIRFKNFTELDVDKIVVK